MTDTRTRATTVLLEPKPGDGCFPRGRTSGRRRGPTRRRVLSKRERQVRAVTGAAVITFVLAVAWSYGAALTAPGNDSFGVRSVEWIRDHGGVSVVNWVEHTWYTWFPPPEGGTPKDGLPGAPTLGATSTGKGGRGDHLRPPRTITPFTATTLPREGQWQPAGPPVQGVPAMYAAYLRPDSLHTSLVAGVAWMDTKLLRARLVPGLEEPGGGTDSWGAQIPTQARPSVIAAFNSAFKTVDAAGGAYVDGRTVAPLVAGQASLVIDRNGVPTVGKWGRDVRMTPNVAAVRQNLQLIVDGGSPVPGLDADASGKWGRTLGNTVFVWRSGVGVDANGGLVYAAGNGLRVSSLARLLSAAGAVRAMELDINSAWVSFDLYSPARNPLKLLPDMQKPANRYFTPGKRDFIAVLPAR